MLGGCDISSSSDHHIHQFGEGSRAHTLSRAKFQFGFLLARCPVCFLVTRAKNKRALLQSTTSGLCSLQANLGFFGTVCLLCCAWVVCFSVSAYFFFCRRRNESVHSEWKVKCRMHAHTCVILTLTHLLAYRQRQRTCTSTTKEENVHFGTRSSNKHTRYNMLVHALYLPHFACVCLLLSERRHSFRRSSSKHNRHTNNERVLQHIDTHSLKHHKYRHNYCCHTNDKHRHNECVCTGRARVFFV